jgi:hypothetical protein
MIIKKTFFNFSTKQRKLSNKMDELKFSISPVLKILKFYGLIPISNVENKILINLFFALISASFWIFNYYLRYGAMNFLLGNEMPITTIGLQVRIFFPLAMILVMIGGSQIFRKKFEEIMKNIFDVDKKVRKKLFQF